MKTRLRRSELAVPAANEKMVEKSAGSEADLVFLDLEDATAPEKKPAARKIAVRALNELDWGNKVRAVRVNDHTTQWAVDDVVEIMEGAGENVDIFILPKVKRPRDVWFFDTLVGCLEKRLGLQRKIGFEVLIEEAEGLGTVESIATASHRLEALILGFGDLAASMGMRFDHELDSSLKYPGDLWHAHRVRLIAACRAAGIDAVDGPFGNYNDHQGYREQATYATALGAVGKWCIHPNQIAHANEVFAPSEREIAMAQSMVDAYNESLKSGKGAGGAAGMLVDAATLRLFEPVLERARMTGRI
jgi:citrate lyase subunit beta/citryl-CoA lyase